MNAQVKTGTVKGRTYTLYAEDGNSSGYYARVEKLAEEFINLTGGRDELLKTVRMMSRRYSFGSVLDLKRIDFTFRNVILNRLKNDLSDYTGDINYHLKNLPILKKFNPELSASEEQYFFYMLEVELVNRIYSKGFKACNYKIALLPHCLHDLERNCTARKDGLDYVCRGCSKNCYINKVSKILRDNDIIPYIWKAAERKTVFKTLRKEHPGLGIFGIACIPELVSGMRACIDNHIPVAGIPLDANKCSRWLGDFYPNSVNLQKLQRILK